PDVSCRAVSWPGQKMDRPDCIGGGPFFYSARLASHKSMTTRSVHQLMATDWFCLACAQPIRWLRFWSSAMPMQRRIPAVQAGDKRLHDKHSATTIPARSAIAFQYNVYQSGKASAFQT